MAKEIYSYIEPQWKCKSDYMQDTCVQYTDMKAFLVYKSYTMETQYQYTLHTCVITFM